MSDYDDDAKFSVTAASDSAGLTIAQWKNYEIDFSKVRTLDDVLAVLRGLQITVTFQDPPDEKWIPLLPYLKAKE